MTEIDPISNTSLYRVPDPLIQEGPEGLEMFLQSKRHIKFKFVPGAAEYGYTFITTDSEYIGKVEPYDTDFKLERIDLPNTLSNIDKNYEQYLNELFKIYKTLGTYRYPISLNEIGLQNSNLEAKRTQDKICYDSLDLMLGNLELLVNQSADNADVADSSDEVQEFERHKINDLMDFYNVLSFIKAVCFSNDLILGKTISFWLNRADINNPPAEVLKQIIELESPYNTDFFYKYLNQLLVRGLFDEACNLIIDCGYESSRNEFLVYLFGSLVKVISSYNLVFEAGCTVDEEGVKTASFIVDLDLEHKTRLLFKAYKQQVHEIVNEINEYLFQAESQDTSLSFEDKTLVLQLKKTFSILSGSHSAIVSNASSWMEALVALVLFDLPSLKMIPEYLEILFNGKFEVNEYEVWEVLCHSLLKNENFLLVLKSLEQFNSDTAAYLSVFLDAKGYLKDYNKLDYIKSKTILEGNFDYELSSEFEPYSNDYFAEVSDLTIGQYLLHNHAMNCLGNKSLVPNAIVILKSLNLNNFKQILTEYLIYNYHCDTQDERDWLLSVCAENKLLYLSNNLYRLFGLELYEKGQYLDSLNCLIKTGDYEVVAQKTWELFDKSLFERYSADSKNVLAQLEHLVGSNTTVSPALKQFLSPCVMLLNYISSEAEDKFSVSKDQLIRLVDFQYIPVESASILLLFLLKYFSLIISSDRSNFSIGHSLFKTEELMGLIKIMDGFQKKVDDAGAEKVGGFYEEYVKLCYTNLHREYSEFDVEIPRSLGELVKGLRVKISWELSRKFLE